MATISLPANGQKLTDIPDYIAQDDQLLRDLLSPTMPDLANATFDRKTTDGLLTVTVHKKAGTKGGETMAQETIREVKQQSATASFEEWCIVELFGHNRIAGLVREATVGGCNFIRVDVPNRDGEGWMYSKLYGNGAIYAINITSQEQVRKAVEMLHPAPYTPRVPESRQIEAVSDDEEYEEY